MCDIIIFGGTTEGRVLSGFCAENKINAYVSVTTDYGASLIDKSGCLHLLINKMNRDEISEFIKSHNIKLAIDATHPYAMEATQNIREACLKTNIRYVRVVREHSFNDYGEYFDNIVQIIEYLNNTTGRILITTGSKSLEHFKLINNFKERCIVRILPSDSFIQNCKRLGFRIDNVIAEKGPFSEEHNIQQIKKYNIKYLVTKDSGNLGGFREKVNSAQKTGCILLVLNRPEDNGISVYDAERILTAENLNE